MKEMTSGRIFTHRALGSLSKSINSVYRKEQGIIWTPNGTDSRGIVALTLPLHAGGFTLPVAHFFERMILAFLGIKRAKEISLTLLAEAKNSALKIVGLEIRRRGRPIQADQTNKTSVGAVQNQPGSLIR